MNEYVAEWSGAWPCLCHGERTLKKNGEVMDIDIPFQGEPAGTFGEYSFWQFGGESGWDEEWHDYEDGMTCDEWVDEHRYWLETIAEEDDWPLIYEAFQESDFRGSSCGGCI